MKIGWVDRETSEAYNPAAPMVLYELSYVNRRQRRDWRSVEGGYALSPSSTDWIEVVGVVG